MLCELFQPKLKMLSFFVWNIPLQFFHEQLGLLIASTALYTMTVINNLGPYSVSMVKPAVKSDVPAPQLPIV